MVFSGPNIPFSRKVTTLSYSLGRIPLYAICLLTKQPPFKGSSLFASIFGMPVGCDKTLQMLSYPFTASVVTAWAAPVSVRRQPHRQLSLVKQGDLFAAPFTRPTSIPPGRRTLPLTTEQNDGCFKYLYQLFGRAHPAAPTEREFLLTGEA